ncbi:MAG: sulfurtransferase [Dehalococcoidia bacterium]|nr:sulfurtransferase [Dehalococcoidia bacterium]
MAVTGRRVLIETGVLAEALDDPDLRVLDCTVYLRRPDADVERRAWRVESGRADWERAHIPGSAFADLVEDLSDRQAPLPFTAPSAPQFGTAMSRLGVGPGTRVVCYDNGLGMWAARVWWLLRAFGFDDASVLDGGWRKWLAEGRPVSTEQQARAAAFVARPRPGCWATADEVLTAVTRGDACVVNALAPEMHRGEGRSPYGRPGRIAGSVNVPAAHLVDPATGAYLPPTELEQRFVAAGVERGRRVVTYCGGGIAATSDALALTLLGYEDVAVYDGSLSEWAGDAQLPMETG